MADSKDIEVLVGKESTETASEGKTGKSTPTTPKDDGAEVSGRSHYNRRMVCWNCDGVSWVWYDTEDYHRYECCYCGAINIFQPPEQILELRGRVCSPPRDLFWRGRRSSPGTGGRVHLRLAFVLSHRGFVPSLLIGDPVEGAHLGKVLPKPRSRSVADGMGRRRAIPPAELALSVSAG